MIISYYLLIIELTESLKSVSIFKRKMRFYWKTLFYIRMSLNSLLQAFSAKELNSLIYFRTKKAIKSNYNYIYKYWLIKLHMHMELKKYRSDVKAKTYLISKICSVANDCSLNCHLQRCKIKHFNISLSTACIKYLWKVHKW